MIGQVPVKRKITIIGDNWGYFEIEDYTAYYNEMFNTEGQEATDYYFRPGLFTEAELNEDNSHFLHGYLERIAQGDKYPPQFYDSNEKLAYQVEIVLDELVIPHDLKSPEIVSTVIEMLKKTHGTSQTFLESLSEATVQNSKASKVFQHYWISNIKLKSLADLLEVSQM